MIDSIVTLKTADIAGAILKRTDFSILENSLLKSLGLPLPEKTYKSDFFINTFMKKGVSVKKNTEAEDRTSNLEPELVLVPFSSNMLKSNNLLEKLIKKIKPCCIAVDTSIWEAGAALHYAFSLEYSLNITSKLLFSTENSGEKSTVFSTQDFIPKVVSRCYEKGIALFPIGSDPKLFVSEHQYIYNRLTEEAHANFSNIVSGETDIEKLRKSADKLISGIFSSGFDFMTARENLIKDSCYAASRLYDILTDGAFEKKGRTRILVLYQLNHALDFPGIIKSMLAEKNVAREFYLPDEPMEPGTYSKIPLETGNASCSAKGHCLKIKEALDEIIKNKMQEELNLEEVEKLSCRLVETLRKNPYIEKPSGARGTLAVKEIAQGYGHINGRLTRLCLAKAGYISLAHRTRIKQSTDSNLQDVLKNAVCRVIYDTPLLPDHMEVSKKKRRPLTPEEIAMALQGLSEAKLKRFESDDGIPIEDDTFADEAMRHPLVQQALKESAESGFFEDPQDKYQELLSELEEREYLQLNDSSHMGTTKKGRNELKERINKACAQGDIDPEQAKDALRNSKAMSASKDSKGQKLFGKPEAESEFMAELMDYQHQGKSESTSLENLYVHYALNKSKDMKAFKEADDYESLKIILHGLEKQGAIKFSKNRKNFSLTHRLLTKLLEKLIQRQDTQLLEKKAFNREHETDKTEIRRYKKGDSFRDISIRHTMRSVLRKGKPIDEINYSDIRSFEKKPLNQLDIVICVDVSASMKESGKLRYAKMAIAELARAAISKNDRVGIVAFSNLGQNVIPLTDKLTTILETSMSLRPDQYTNMGNGLRSARKMLLKDKNGNQKYIVLITDGEPNAALSDDSKGAKYYKNVASFSKSTTMEQKKSLGTHHALIEASKTARQHIKISVVYISPEEEASESENTARSIARTGNGKFHKVKSIEHLPSEALATVG